MNNIHDMGGMHGFGPIPIEEDEPVFHSDWEARAMAITVAMAAWQKWSIDASRYARERLPALTYLEYSYYERWIAALVDLAVETGLLTLDEVETGEPAPGAESRDPPLTGKAVSRVISRGGPANRKIEAAPRFAVGDRVRTSTASPRGHTRLPRYARGRTGEILMHHGAHVFPDTNAHGQGENPQHLYTVKFTARELWGPEANPNDTVTLDLWESYLDGL